MAAQAGGRQIRIDAGEVSGQLVVGDHNLVVMAEAGALVTVVQGDHPEPTRRDRPLRVLPRAFPDLLDRRAESDVAGTAIPASTSVELSGERGIGKSVLLRELAHATASALPEGVVYGSVRGDPLEDVLQFVFESLYRPAVAGGTPVKPTDAELSRLLAEEPLLVVLDDVTLDRDEVEDLLNRAPRSGFLITTEERRLWGEGKVLTLTGLPDEFATPLIERALGRPLTEDELPSVRTLWTALEGHPLRVLQAVSAVRDGRASLDQVAAGADGSTVLLSSIECVGGRERDVLAIVTAAEGASVPAETIEAIVETDPGRELEDLERRGLLTSASPSRSAVAVSAGQEAGLVIEPWGERLASYVIGFCEQHGSEPEQIVEQLELVRWALEWSVERQRWSEALRLARAIDGPVTLRGRWGTWGLALERALMAARALGDARAEGWALHQVGTRALCRDEFALADEALTGALEIRRRVGDRRGEEITRNNLDVLHGIPPTGGSGGDGPHGPVRPPGPPVRALAGVAAAVVLAGTAVLLTTRGRALSPTPAGSVRVSAHAISFRARTIGLRSEVRTARVTNVGGGPVRMGRVLVTGETPAAFIFHDRCSGRSIAPAGSCEIAVVFAPTTVGEARARMSIPQESGSTLPVALRGLGISPALRVDTERLDFGTIDVGSSAKRVVVVRNHGVPGLALHDVVLTGSDRRDYRIVWTSCSSTRLAIHGSCRIQVVFAPVSAGVRSAVLTISHSGPGSPLPVPLLGRGTAPPVPAAPALQAEPRLLGFGARPVGSVTRGSVKVTNVGGQSTRPSASMAYGSAFSISDSTTCGSADLAPGASCYVGVDFRPTRQGPFGATVHLAGGGVPAGTFSLGGEGVVSPPSSHRLTAFTAGDGAGRITSRPAGIDCTTTCSASFPAGSAVTLMATANNDSTFGGWGGACAGTEGASCTLSMSADRSVGATFDAVRYFLLDLNQDGNGRETSDPPGIDCTSSCSASFPESTVLTITATPAEDWFIYGWQGDCDGNGPTCTVTMSADRSVVIVYSTIGLQANPSGSRSNEEDIWTMTGALAIGIR